MNSAFLFDHLLTLQAKIRPEATAVVQGDLEVSYARLNEDVAYTAALLKTLNIARGDRVGVHLPKGVDEIVATFAASRIGAVFVNVNYSWTPEQLEHVVTDCKIGVLVTDARKKIAIQNRPSLCRELLALVTRCRPDSVPESDGEPRCVRWDKDPNLEPDYGHKHDSIDTDLAALLYTSGSTGRPKGVMLTHRNLIAGAQSVAQYLKNSPDDRLLSLLPLSFDYGLSQITTAFLVGAQVVLQQVSMPSELLRVIGKHQVTGFAAVPTVWVQLVDHLTDTGEAIDSLRYVTNSGGKIPAATLEKMPAVFRGTEIFLMYGLTEAFRSTYLPPSKFSEKMGSMGCVIPNAELFVVHPETGICGPDEEGELLHRGALVSKGYWGNQPATDEKIKPNPHLYSLIGDEPVLHSGDIVKWDSEGYLWFVGRNDGLIKCSGFRVSPEEVEEHLYRHELVSAAIAFGRPDEKLGEAIHVAVLTRNPESSAESDLAIALLHYCRQKMPNYMIPKKFHFWEGEFPLTSSGKIDRPNVKGSLALS